MNTTGKQRELTREQKFVFFCIANDPRNLRPSDWLSGVYPGRMQPAEVRESAVMPAQVAVTIALHKYRMRQAWDALVSFWRTLGFMPSEKRKALL